MSLRNKFIFCEYSKRLRDARTQIIIALDVREVQLAPRKNVLTVAQLAVGNLLTADLLCSRFH
jgi:hypothetical protein